MPNPRFTCVNYVLTGENILRCIRHLKQKVNTVYNMVTRLIISCLEILKLVHPFQQNRGPLEPVSNLSTIKWNCFRSFIKKVPNAFTKYAQICRWWLEIVASACQTINDSFEKMCQEYATKIGNQCNHGKKVFKGK